MSSFSTSATLQTYAGRGNLVARTLGFFFASRIAITLVGFQAQPSAGTAAWIASGLALLFLVWVGTENVSMPSLRHGPIRWIAGYLVLVAVSLFWSVTQSPATAIAYWLGLVTDCVSVYMLLASGEQLAACYAMMEGFLTGASVVGIIAWLLPTLPDLRIGDEDFLHPNALGYTLAIATLFGVRLVRRSPAMATMTAFCGVTLLRTISKASIAGFAAAAIYLLLRDAHLSKKTKAFIAVASAAIIVSSWSLVEAYVEMYGRGSNFETLTGRTYIWSVAWEEALRTPWLGHGFYSFRFVVPVLGDFEPWQAHNELLQQFFGYGVLGLAFFVTLYAAFVRHVRKFRNSAFASVALAIMIFAIVRGLVDAERFDLNYPLWLLTMFSLVVPATLLDTQ